MKSTWNFGLVLALGVGLLGTAATAQSTQLNRGGRVENAIADAGQSGQLQLAGWDDHRRCDGDHDRDDRGCYYRDYDHYRYYGYSYYGNAYAAPYYGPPAGWYDREGHWHAYDRDRDRDRRRHDDDDRR